MKYSHYIEKLGKYSKHVNKWSWAAVIVVLAGFYTIADAFGCSIEMSTIDGLKISSWVGALCVLSAVTTAFDKTKFSKKKLF